MKPKSAQPPADQRLRRVAGRQYGVVTHAQLLRIGIGVTGIKERLRTGRLIRLHRGVYAVGHRELKRDGYWLAAILACGPGAVLSHTDAAAHWNIRQSSSAVIHVTVPTRAGRPRRKGVRIHRSGRLRLEEVTVREGIPVTTVARTLLDLADILSDQALKRTIHEADYQRLFDQTTLIAVVQGNPGRRGAKLLRAAESPPEMTRNEFEDRFLDIVKRHRLPTPIVNGWIEGYEVDFAWPGAKLIVETDGFAAHGTRRAFENDRRRDRRLTRAGFRTIRLTPRSLAYEAEIVADLEAMLPLTRSSTSSARTR
jgi:very-short-patch-repair endonuclease